MANSDKDIVITPNVGSSSDDPNIVFSGANSSIAAQDITLTVYPLSNGTLSFDGSSGQLFSITNDLSGTIFSVNDISGIPSIEVNADGYVKLAEFGGNTSIGADTLIVSYDDRTLYVGNTTVNANVHITGSIKDSSGDFGTSGQVLSSTGTGINWIDASAISGALTASNGLANRIAVFTSSSNIEGDANFTWDGSTLSTGSSSAIEAQRFIAKTSTYTSITDYALEDNGVIRAGSGLWLVGGATGLTTGIQFGTRPSAANDSSGGWNADVTERMRIQNDGNVGIACTSPSVALDIVGDTQITNQGDDAVLLKFNTERAWSFLQNSTGASAELELNSEVDGKFFRITSQDRSSVFAASASNTDADSRIHMVPDGGLVGIGTASPSSSLDIVSEPNVASIEAATTLNDIDLSRNGTFIRLLASNTTATMTADRNRIGLRVDVDNSTASADNNTSGQRIRLYGIYNSSDTSEAVYFNWAAYNLAQTTHTTGTMTSQVAGYNLSDHDGTGDLSSIYGSVNEARTTSSATITNIYGSNSRASIIGGSTSTVSTAMGARAEVLIQDSTGASITNARAVYGALNFDDINLPASTVSSADAIYSYIDFEPNNSTQYVTNASLYRGVYASGSDTSISGGRWGIYLSGEDKNTIEGKLGIGTTTPSVALDVVGDVRISDTTPNLILDDTDGTLGGSSVALLEFRATGSSQGTLGFNGSIGAMNVENKQGDLYLKADSNNAKADSKIFFQIDGGTEAVISTSGIGIACTSPNQPLIVNMPDNIKGAYFTDGTRNVRLFSGNLTAGQYNPIVEATDNAIIYSGGSVNTGALVIAGHHSGNDTGMRFTNDGRIYVASNVGIGTTSPTQALDVVGTINTSANVHITGAIRDSGGSFGTSGQVLSSTGIGIDWIDAGSGGGGTVTSTGGADNRIAVFTATADEIEGDANLTWDGLNLNVLSQTSYPNIEIESNRDSGSAAANFKFYRSKGGTGGPTNLSSGSLGNIYFYAYTGGSYQIQNFISSRTFQTFGGTGADLGFGNGTTEILTITKEGKVGINQTNADYSLDVGETSTTNYPVRINAPRPVVFLTGQVGQDNPEAYIGINSSAGGFGGANTTNLEIISSNDIILWPFAISPEVYTLFSANGAMIDSSFGFAIKPKDQLHIFAGGSTGPSANATVRLEGDYGNPGYMQVYSGDSHAGLKTSSSFLPLVFSTDNTERMRIEAAGNITINESGNDQDFRIESSSNANAFKVDAGNGAGVLFSGGTTDTPWNVTTGNGNLAYRIDNGSAYGSLAMSNNADRGWSAMYINKFAYTSGDDQRYIQWWVNGSALASIQLNSAGTAIEYNTSSDRRLKENIVDIVDGIARVKQLQPKKYTWIGTDFNAEGFIADEADGIVPEAVNGEPNAVDSDGNPIYMQIEYSRYIPLLTAALKETIAKNEELEARIAALENA